MKRLICAMLIFIIAIMTGCETKKPEQEFETESVSEFEQVVESAETDYYMPEEPTAEKVINESEIIDKYAKIYNTYISYTDMFIPEKHLLIGDSKIVVLFITKDFNHVISVERKDIERIEHSEFEELGIIEIFDKTNQVISITVDPDTLNTILDILK